MKPHHKDAIMKAIVGRKQTVEEKTKRSEIMKAIWAKRKCIT
jgi:hypothetical protein